MTLLRELVENPWWTLAVMVTWVAVSIWLEQSRRWAAKVSGPVLVLGGAVLFASFGVIPAASPVYDSIWDYIVPICIPLLLFRADIVTILRESGRLFLVFHFAAIGTAVGAFLAAVFLRGADLPESGKLIGIMTGSYTGGSVNFVALTKQFEPDEEMANALIVADNLVMAVLFLVCFALPAIPWLRRAFRTPHVDAQEASGDTAAATQAAAYWKPKPIALVDIAQALAIAVTLAGAAHLLAQALEASPLPEPVLAVVGQPYLVMTALCVALATFGRAWLAKISGAEELGTYLIYLFFFVIGAPADVVKIVREVPILFVLCGIMATSNLVVTLLLTWIARRDLEEAAIAINATLGGAPSAAAMAIAKGWTPLVLPSILVGIWGYVVGTYIGFAVGKMLGAG